MTLFLRVTDPEIESIIKRFLEYRENTGRIKILMAKSLPKREIEYREYTPIYAYDGAVLLIPLELRITYLGPDRGIKWTIRAEQHREEFKAYIVEATINPKILGGIRDYITAATYDDMDAAIANFNSISQSISPLLRMFEDYSLKRIDYCINLSVNELAPGCNPEQIMNLIKRSDIPPHYREWMKYDETAHRMKSRPSSFYLMNQSVTINCYSKYMKFQEQSVENVKRGYPPIPQATMDAARDIIRFEVQCKYRKTYSISRIAKADGNDSINKYESLLTEGFCMEIINHYFDATIGRANWYSLRAAISLVKSHEFNAQKENRLIRALQEVSRCRSLAKAKAQYQGDDLAAFKRTLKELSDLGINPVTIPKAWGIGRIWNLLDAYYCKKSCERVEKNFLKETFLKDNSLLL